MRDSVYIDERDITWEKLQKFTRYPTSARELSFDTLVTLLHSEQKRTSLPTLLITNATDAHDSEWTPKFHP